MPEKFLQLSSLGLPIESSSLFDAFGSLAVIGQDQASGTITLRFRSVNAGNLQWNPTASRTLTLPDATGTIALTTLLSAATAPITCNDQTLSRYGTACTIVSTTAYTLSNADNGVQLVFTAASAVAVTVPTGLVAGFGCWIRQKGIGKVTIGKANGVSLLNVGNVYTTSGPGAMLFILPDPTAANSYFVDGFAGSLLNLSIL